ncbi:MAG: YgjV family protein [Ruminococcaceae bacterium]|nr:YgjV family protein [Oscillospiraceae bacterium]
MEQILYFIGQVLGIVAVILGFINYQMKTREQVLYIHIATTICFAFHYMLIGAYAGMAMNFVGFVRNLVFYYVGKNSKVGRGWAILFAVLMGTMGIVGWEAWYSVLAVVGLIINSYSMSFSNPNNIRKSILITSPLVLIYDAFALSIGGMIYESVVIISSIIGLVRFNREKK